MTSLKSIQRGSSSIAYSATSTTATITAVDTAKAFVVIHISGGYDRGGYYPVGAWFSSTTQLTFQRQSGASLGGTLTIRWEVIEFNSGVACQHGVVSDIDGTSNVTITSVNTSKTFAFTTQWGYFSYDADANYFSTSEITTSTNLAIKCDPPGLNTNDIRWTTVEYADCSVQKISKSLNVSGTSDSSTITSCTIAKTMLVGSAIAPSGLFVTDWAWRWKQSATTTISYERAWSGTNASESAILYAVTFTDSTNVQHFVQTWDSGDTSKNITITSLDTSRSFVMGKNTYWRAGLTLSNNVDKLRAFVSSYLSSSTNISGTRSASGTEGVQNIQAVEFGASTRKNGFFSFIGELVAT